MACPGSTWLSAGTRDSRALRRDTGCRCRLRRDLATRARRQASSARRESSEAQAARVTCTPSRPAPAPPQGGYQLPHGEVLALEDARRSEGRSRSASMFQLIAYSPDRLRVHIEAQFTEGMSWANYGTTWHIDHVRPCASFDLSNPLQQRACFNFVNLRPLWKPDNGSKGSTYGGVRYRRDRRVMFVRAVARIRLSR